MLKLSSLVYVVLAAFVFANVCVAKDDQVKLFELKKGNLSVKFTNWGATIVSVVLPDKTGKLGDIVLGYDSAEEYKNDTTYFGALVGRVINRIGGAKFTLNGTTYKLDANEGNNTIHGGKKGFSKLIWKVGSYQPKAKLPYITFVHESPDGDQGFPGAVLAEVTYKLHENQKFGVVMKAKALTKPTPVNLGQHTYWNLGNHNSGNILSHKVQISASQITLLDPSAIPTGQIVPVKGTPYDFLKSHTVRSRINKLPQGEYNINYVIDGPQGFKKVAVVKNKESGRVMELFTNAPAVQLYTAFYLNNVTGKGGYVYGPYGALCLETQGFPDAVNHPNFPSVIVSPGKPYEHVMLFKFSAK